MLIGFYNPSVILTYIGLAVTIFGMTLATEGHLKGAIICLMVSGFCDMFDGTIARRIKRSHEAQLFGVQLDSLCDVICFGVFPAVIAYNSGMKGLVGVFAMILYILGAVIRLGFFNVQEEIRSQTTGKRRTYYQGLPVTSMALLFPLVSLLSVWIPARREHIYTVTLVAAAIAFVLNVPVKKPGLRTLMIMAFIGLLILIVMLALGKQFV